MKKIICKSKADIEILRNGSALTWEGLDVSAISLKRVANWIEEHTKMKNKRCYVTSGKLMNDSYDLTGDNRYPDDLNIVSVKLDDLENFNAIVLPRFQTNGRWMDDIIDNNLRREGRA